MLLVFWWSCQRSSVLIKSDSWLFSFTFSGVCYLLRHPNLTTSQDGRFTAGNLMWRQSRRAHLPCTHNPQYTLSEMKWACPQNKASFYPIKRPKDVSLWHDWFQFAKLHLYVAKAVCYKGPGFSRCHNYERYSSSIWWDEKLEGFWGKANFIRRTFQQCHHR